MRPGVVSGASGKKWFPKVDGRGHYWEEEIEKLDKYIPTSKRNNRKVCDKTIVESRVSLRQRALELVGQMGTVRTKDLEAIGVPRRYPRMMCEEGLLEQVGYGRYRAANLELIAANSPR